MKPNNRRRPLFLPLCSLCSLWLTLVGLHGASFTPETAAAFAMRQNPDLIAARFLIREAEGRLIQAGLWSNPEFQLSSNFNRTRSSGDRMGGLLISQKFPLAGRLQKARAAARVDVAMAIEELHDQERLLAGQVLGQARAILLLDQRLAIQARQLQLLERITAQTSDLAAFGKMDTASIGVAQLEKTTLELQRRSQSVARQAALDQLTGLLGFQPGTELTITGSLPKMPRNWSVEPNRPDLRLAALATNKAAAEKHLARAERWEEATVGAGLGRERDDGEYNNLAALQFSIPLPLWNRNQGRISEAEARQQRAAAELAARQLTVATEIREAQTRAIGFGEILGQLAASATAQARQNTTLIEQSVTSGFDSFLTIYESQRQTLALELTFLETQTQQTAALTDWQTRTGRVPNE